MHLIPISLKAKETICIETELREDFQIHLSGNKSIEKAERGWVVERYEAMKNFSN